MTAPWSQRKTMVPTAFLVKLALIATTNMAKRWPERRICRSASKPVENSAAMPSTAQNMLLKGFWFSQPWVTCIWQPVASS